MESEEEGEDRLRGGRGKMGSGGKGKNGIRGGDVASGGKRERGEGENTLPRGSSRTHNAAVRVANKSGHFPRV